MSEQNLSEAGEIVTAKLTRDDAISMLKRAGVSLARIDVPEGVRQLTSEEREILGRVRPGTLSATEIIDEGRG